MNCPIRRTIIRIGAPAKIESDRAIIRIEMSGQFVERDFSHNFMTFARPAFRKALQQIKA
jgi:hypothetical protein